MKTLRRPDLGTGFDCLGICGKRSALPLVADSDGLSLRTESGEHIMNQEGKRHRYAAHVRDKGVHSRQWVAEADSFVDAAVLFAETAHLGDGDISIVVT